MTSNNNDTLRKYSVNRLWWYLIIVVLLSVFCFVTLHIWLTPYSVMYNNDGVMTAGYFLYATIGILFSTPSPFIAVLIIYIFKDKTGVRSLFHDIFNTEYPLKTILITGGLCLMCLIYALLFGEANGSPWYMFLVGFLIMIPFVGIAEETGWRGLLQPEIDKRIKYPFSVLVVAAIWFVWHMPDWVDPTSNHHDDSVIGFGITIFIWAFVLATLYKATKSIIACAVYHAFVDSIGAVYDWNQLFDSFPGSASVNVYRFLWLAAGIILYLMAAKKEKRIN